MAATDGAEWVDNFHFRGSRTWRRMGGHLTKGRWRTQVAHQVAHAFDNYKLHYQRAQPLPLWFRLCLESLIGSGLARIPRVLYGKAQ